MSTDTTIDVRQGWTSASNALSDSLCPGRHLAQKGIPEPAKDPDALSGARIHAALAYDPEKPGLDNPENDKRKLSLDELEVFDACRDIEKKVAGQYFGAKHPPMRVFRHERYWLRNLGPNKLGHSGEADVVFRAGTRVLIADYKTLLGDVPDSPRNLQLRHLAVLVWRGLVTVQEVATVIIQPFVTHTPELCVYTTEDLLRAEAELWAQVVASNDPASPRVAGEAQCKFCLAKPNCVIYQKWAAQMTPPAMLSVMEVAMSEWTPEQRAVAANALKPALDFLENLKEFLKDGLANDPAFVPGWGLKEGSKRSTITNPEEVFARFAKLGGTGEQFMKSVAVNKGKLREALNSVTGAKGQALDRAVDALVVDCIETKTTAPSLVKL